MRRLLASLRKLNEHLIENNVKRYPLIANSLFYGGIYGLSDVSNQLVVKPLATGKPRDDFHFDSAFRFWFMGTFVFGPSVTSFVRFANWLVPGSSLSAACKKILLDQMVMPLPMLTSFYLGMNLLQGNSFQDFQREWKMKFVPTWLTALCYFPVVQLICWTQVPHLWRPRYLSLSAFVWSNFLCFAKSVPVPEG